MSETCAWLTILQLVFPLLCFLNFAPAISRYGFAWAGLAGIALYEVILLTTPLILGHLEYLHPHVYRAAYVGVAGLLACRGIFCLKPLFKALISIRYRPQWIDPVIVLCLYTFGAIAVYELVRAWKGGPPEFDTIGYHVPRAMLWTWHGNFRPWVTAIWQQLGSAYGGSASLLPSVFLGCGYLSFSWVSVLYGIGAALGVHVIARALGLSGRASLLAMLAFLTFPPTFLRLRGVSSDIAATFPVIAGIAFFMTHASHRVGIFLLVSLTGLGMACKQYVVFSAAFIFLVLSVVYRKRVWKLENVSPALLGGCATLFLLFLSYYPVYVAFGDVVGGAVGRDHSVMGRGFDGMRDSVAYNLNTWLAEPLAALPRAQGEEWFRRLGFSKLNELSTLGPTVEFLPSYNGNDLRSGLVPLIALPWLVMAIPRGRRLLVFFGFLLLVAVQTAPIALNTTGRFVIIPLAAFALLWGFRARTAPLIVAFFIMASFLVSRHHMGMQEYIPTVSAQWIPDRGECPEFSQSVRDDTLLVLTRSLSTDATISTRDGRTKFEYVACPDDDNWPQHLANLRGSYRWFAMYPETGKMTPGPMFDTLYKKNCARKTVTVEQMRGWLTQAGWHFVGLQKCGLDLWAASPAASAPVPPAS